MRLKILLIITLQILFTQSYTLPSMASSTENTKLKMAENNPAAGVLCKAYKLLTHGITKALITLLFIITGLGFFIGKISWGIVISLLIGTALTLTSGTLVGTFVGEAGKGGGEGDVCECKYGLDESSGGCKSAFVS